MINKKNYWLFSIVLLAAAESSYGTCCPCEDRDDKFLTILKNKEPEQVERDLIDADKEPPASINLLLN